MRYALKLLALILLCLAANDLAAQELDPAGADFFERSIRPVLVESCYECHSASSKQLQGGLLLDSREGLRKGGESGAAIVPGNSAASMLLQALRYESFQMPPVGKLPEATIADFAKWIDAGAFDPRDSAESAPADAKSIDFDAAKQHWAYQPIRRPATPAVENPAWCETPIDRFIVSKLEAKGLLPAPLADRRTLIRRLYHDCLGLPPTPSEVAAFVADESLGAYERLVDRLLASPHFGERWGRHWLDVARYADTKDLVLQFGADRMRPYSYTYRDYVIRATNDDTPYDHFIVEQLAADKLDGIAPWRKAAMGFLTLGRLFDNNPHDIYDDQIDTVGRGLLGLTIACARCHDHKYDAIATADYYSLYSVFANSQTPIELPLAGPDEQTSDRKAFEKEAAPKRAAVSAFVETQHRQITATARKRVAEYLERVATKPPDVTETAVFYLSLSPDDLKPQIVASWRRYLDRRSNPNDPVFGIWRRLMELPDANFAVAAARAMSEWLARPEGIDAGQVNPLVKAALAGTTLESKADIAKVYGALLGEFAEGSPPEDAAGRQLYDALHADDSPCAIPLAHTYLYMSRVERGDYEGQLLGLDKLAVTHPGAPARAMVLVDSPRLHECRVFVRGNPSQPGDPAPRQFLRLLAGAERRPFTDGSGRLELAHAIASPENPLTARVIVNRLWMHHFGEPLVATASDFGARSESPTHPELLDYLAARLIESGWSLKSLHREILLSSVYRQSAQERPECRAVDPDNRLLWRANRRRLGLEAMRDTLLALSGRLDHSMYGRPVDVAGDPQNRRRTVYGLVDRQDLPGLYRAFDFASPDQSAAGRPVTTTPQQALFGLNSAFVETQARALAARPEVISAGDFNSQAAALMEIVWQRPAAPEEIEAAVSFLKSAEAEDNHSEAAISPLEQLAQALLATNELMFVD